MRLLTFLVIAAVISSRPAPAAPEPPVYVIAAANAESFDHDLPVLRYAHDDLQRFARVMSETGMIPRDHVVTVSEGRGADLRRAFTEVTRKMRQDARARQGKFIF